jgi:hypothetical protein
MPFIAQPNIGSKNEGAVVTGLQITDLSPHKTQSNATISPNFQGPYYFIPHPKYSTLISATPKVTATMADGADAVSVEVEGLASYLLYTVEDTNNGGSRILPLVADQIADDIRERMFSGLSLTLEDINTIMATRFGVNTNGIGKGASTATVKEILGLVSGYKFFGSIENDVIGSVNGADFAAFDVNALVPFARFSDWSSGTGVPASLFTKFYSSFYVSARRGQIKKAQTRTIKGVVTPFIVCYNDEGILIQ